MQISGEVSATGSPYGWYSQGLQDYSTGFATIFDVLISANRSQDILVMLQDGHYIDEQTASRPNDIVLSHVLAHLIFLISDVQREVQHL